MRSKKPKNDLALIPDPEGDDALLADVFGFASATKSFGKKGGSFEDLDDVDDDTKIFCHVFDREAAGSCGPEQEDQV